MTTQSGSSVSTDLSAESIGITSDLLAVLVCPIDHGTLEVRASKLVCTLCGRSYTVEDGIPNMVVADEEGER